MSNNLKSKQSMFTNEDLKQMQSWDLDRKIAVSLTRIAEFYEKYPLKTVILFPYTRQSFS